MSLLSPRGVRPPASGRLKAGSTQRPAMTDPADPEAPDDGLWARSTAPQSPFTARQVWTGFVVLAVGLGVAFVLPLALA